MNKIEITFAKAYINCKCDKNDEEYKTIVSALEKQIPKKPINTWGRYWGTAKGGYCPICNSMVNSREHQYCKKCGQALDWSDTE